MPYWTSRTCCTKCTILTCEQKSHNLKIAFVIFTYINIGLFAIGTRLIFITWLTCEQKSHNLKIAFVIFTYINIGLFAIGTRLIFITWLTKNNFSKRTQFLLLYSLFTIPKKYLLPAKRKMSYMSGKLRMWVLHWILQARTQGGSLGANEPPFEMRCQLNNYKATTLN